MKTTEHLDIIKGKINKNITISIDSVANDSDDKKSLEFVGKINGYGRVGFDIEVFKTNKSGGGITDFSKQEISILAKFFEALFIVQNDDEKFKNEECDLAYDIIEMDLHDKIMSMRNKFKDIRIYVNFGFKTLKKSVNKIFQQMLID